MPLHEGHLRLLCVSGVFNDVLGELLNALSEEVVATDSNLITAGNQSPLSLILQKNQTTLNKLNALSTDSNRNKIYDISNRTSIKMSLDISKFDTSLICELLCCIEDYPTYCGKKTISCNNASCFGKCCSSCNHTCKTCGKVKCGKGCIAHRKCNHMCTSCQMISSACTSNKNVCCSICKLCGFCSSRQPSIGQCSTFKLKSNIITVRNLRNICAHGREEEFEGLQRNNIPLPHFRIYNDWKSLCKMLTETLDDFLSYLSIEKAHFPMSNTYISDIQKRSFLADFHIALNGSTQKVKNNFDEYLKNSLVVEELHFIKTSIKDMMVSTSESMSEIKDSIVSTSEDISKIKDIVNAIKPGSFSKDDVVLIKKMINGTQSNDPIITPSSPPSIRIEVFGSGVESDVDDTELNIRVSCTAEYTDYAYTRRHNISAVVSLKAPCLRDNTYVERPPMDIVAVMDKSSSMAGEKLRFVKRTLEFVLRQLGEQDRFSLITYDEDVYVDFKLKKMNEKNKEIASSKIKDITPGVFTNLCGGLMKGLCQIADRRAKKKNEVASVLLFTDGLANEGITNVVGIVGAMKNPKMFDAPAASKEHLPCDNRLRFCSVGSDESDDNSPSCEEVDASVYTFGFGADHDADMLKQISDAGNGMYYFIEKEEKIGKSFAHCLGGLLSTVAQGIQLKVTTQDGVFIQKVQTARPFERLDNKSVKVNIGDMQSEESRDIIFELSVDPVAAPCSSNPQCLLYADVNYFNEISTKIVTECGSLQVIRSEDESSRDTSHINAKVTKEKCRVQMTDAIRRASVMAAAGEYKRASKLLSEELVTVKISNDSAGDFKEDYDAMAYDLAECRDSVSCQDAWKTKGKYLQPNMLQQYECQRSSMVNGRAYQTRRKSTTVDFFENWQKSTYV